MRFLKSDGEDAEGEMTWEGLEDLTGYFYREAFNMFMSECPALLTGFLKVQKNLNPVSVT